jgi:hypothetical protein
MLKEFLRNLDKIANCLEENGLSKLASEIDSLSLKLAEDWKAPRTHGPLGSPPESRPYEEKSKGKYFPRDTEKERKILQSLKVKSKHLPSEMIEKIKKIVDDEYIPGASSSQKLEVVVGRALKELAPQIDKEALELGHDKIKEAVGLCDNLIKVMESDKNF